MELGQSDHFKSWAKAKGAVLCPTVNYNHTLNFQSECYVRITKEHLRCMLLSSNAPKRLWPFALQRFCKIFGWWPKANTSRWQMALHLGNSSARNINSQPTWIEICMLSAATVLGIFPEKVSSWKTQPSTTMALRVRSL